MTDDDRRFDLYKTYRAELISSRETNSEQIGKIILTFSGGGLALSLAFMKDFVPVAHARVMWCLYASWMFFALAILLNLASSVVGQLADDSALEAWDRAYLEDETATSVNPWSSWADRFSLTSICAFIIAVILTVGFAWYNMDVARTSPQLNVREEIQWNLRLC